MLFKGDRATVDGLAHDLATLLRPHQVPLALIRIDAVARILPIKHGWLRLNRHLEHRLGVALLKSLSVRMLLQYRSQQVRISLSLLRLGLESHLCLVQRRRTYDLAPRILLCRLNFNFSGGWSWQLRQLLRHLDHPSSPQEHERVVHHREGIQPRWVFGDLIIAEILYPKRTRDYVDEPGHRCQQH